MMPKYSVLNVLHSVWDNYIAYTVEDRKMSTKENKLLSPKEAVAETKSRSTSPFSRELSDAKCREIAKQCPLFMKAARKRALDSISSWHRIERLDEKKNPVKQDMDIIEEFIQRTNLRKKWMIMKVESYITGDGYLLYTFTNDNTVELWEEPTPGSFPQNVFSLKGEHITEIDYYPPKKEYFRELNVKHYHFRDAKTGQDYWIHPDRVIHRVCDQLADSSFGNSKVNLLRHVIKSIVNVDIACGETLAWFAHGVFDIEQFGLNDNLKKKWEKTANEHPGAWIHDETAKITTIAPTSIDPKPFYDFLTLKVAAAFVMPEHILKGVQVGRVTGAEVGTGDYHKDIKDEQDLEDSPLLIALYAKLLSGHGREWSTDGKVKYHLVWNPLYVDELSEALIMEKRVTSADRALNGSKGMGGFADVQEARLIFNHGQIELDINKIPKRPIAPQPPKRPPSGTEAKPEKPEKKDNSLYDMQLDEASRAMIAKRKAVIEHEKKLGEEVLREQDASNN